MSIFKRFKKPKYRIGKHTGLTILTVSDSKLVCTFESGNEDLAKKVCELINS